MAALDALDEWPVGAVAAAVIGPTGVLAGHGDAERVFALASVTKPLAARAVHVAVEEGAVELDAAAGPPGATIRHLLAHTSGLSMHSDQVLAPPGTRRIYSNQGFTVLGQTLEEETGIEFARYLHEAVCQPLGMTATRLDGGAVAAGFGATSTVADLAAFAGDLLRPTTVSARLHAEATTVQFPGLDGVLPGYGCSGPTIGGSVSSCATARRRTGPARPTRRERTVISARRAASSGPTPTSSGRWWCSPTAISGSGRWTGGRRFRTP